ncbi:MAG: hypothetical protein ACRD0P_03765 [Stackebrandtia sp.]
MEDEESVSGESLPHDDVTVGGVRYRMTCLAPHGVVCVRKLRNRRIGPIIAVAYRLNDDPFIKQYEGSHIPARELEALRNHMSTFHHDVTSEKVLAHV